jgi:diguanylate cyclase (GGDEF)-like protein
MSNPFRSLATRIVLLVFVATVVSALTVTWISVQSLDSFLRQKVDQRFPQVANRIARELDHWYTLRTRDLEVFAGSAILTESIPQLEAGGRRGKRARNEVEQYLRYVLNNFSQFEQLGIIGLEGLPLITVGHDELPADLIAAAPSLAEAMSIGHVERVGNRRVQVASVPMRDPSGKSMARLAAVIDLDQISSILVSKELGEDAHLYIVDRDSRILNPPDGSDEVILFVDSTSQSMYASDDTSSAYYYENASTMRVVGTQIPFPRFGWTLVLEQSYDAAFAPVVSSLSRVAALNLAIVFVVGLAATQIARSFVQPLASLSDAAKRLSQGEREVEIEETTFSSDEINVLTRTFNEMSRGLGRNARELEESHRAVEVANHELTAKNEELSSMNLILEQLSITDGLTKLHNHRYFQESFARECKRASRANDPLCLILIDIDHFKKWNDRLGHAGGDEILRMLADVLNRCVRETDLLTRYGGEEFALLAIKTDLEGAIALAEKIRQSVELTNFVTDVPSEKEQLTVSIGIAAFQGDAQKFFSDADSALYAAKDAGRNRLVVALVGKPKSAKNPKTRD